MVYLEVKHTVADYAKWRVGFDNHESARRAAGATGVKQVYRGVEDPNAITIIMEWDSAENAQRFVADPSLREVMAEAGVTSAPEAVFLQRV
jgi:heme-degrading monooxygenase HmoA